MINDNKNRSMINDNKNRSMIMINDNKNTSSIVVEVIRTVLFFYQDTLHKNKTHKYLNTPTKHNKAHKLGDTCPDKIADINNQ